MTTTTIVYLKPDGSVHSDDDQARIERFRSELMDGTVFRRGSVNHNLGYEPVLDRRSWSHAMVTISKMGARSDALAQVATRILHGVNLYGTRGDAVAQIYRAAEQALAQGYDDVVRRSGPEPGRFSDNQHDFNLVERVTLLVWLDEATAKLVSCVPCVGWCLRAIAQSCAPNLLNQVHNFPSLNLAASR